MLVKTFLLLFFLGSALASGAPIDFGRDVRPILSDYCFHCHGPDESTREAKLRLDTKEGLFTERDGIVPIKPGRLEESDAWLRVISQDRDDVMPPPKSHKQLTAAQVETLKRWIEAGAPFQEHWAFTAPRKAEPPKLANAWWPRQPIDNFIGARLEERGLRASPEATKETLLRRATFDLTGLPPTMAELDAFLADTAPEAYERAVDRLLASPRYGEHMARYWLDAARYGDTHGLHLDNERSMWPYRDWVVRAFNENLSFDQFTIWQLAGDQLPNATREQQIASGFNRCNVTTSEGGAINEEFLYRYAVERTETTAAVWMGLTAGCAACHDHKFDPISTKEFYSLYAFFNSAADPAMDGNKIDTPPILRLTTPAQEQQTKELDARIADATKRLKAAIEGLAYVDPASQNPPPPVRTVENVWVDDDFPQGAKASVAGHPLQWSRAADGAPIHSGERVLKRTGQGIAQDFFTGVREPFVVPAGGRIFAYVYLDPIDPPKAIMLQWHQDGWKLRANWGDPDVITFGISGTPEKLQMGALPQPGAWTRLEVDVEKLKLKPGAKLDGFAFTQYGGTVYWDKAGIAYEDNPAADPVQSQIAWEKANQGKNLGEKAPKEIREIFRSVKPEERTPAHQAQLREYFLGEVYTRSGTPLTPLRQERKQLEEQQKKLDDEIVKTFIMRDLDKPRPAHVMVRGQYDKPGELVKPGAPAFLPPLRTEDEARRLDLARWLVQPEHPLMARVTVNRFWQQFFGTGLVKTAGDFGAQGESPSHPELLDWLAIDFRESGWDVKKLVRRLVTSAAYRQDSRATPELLEADPENRLLARGPRFRFDAETIRDNALFVSGLLDPAMGGKGVNPYQPENIWEPVGFVGSNTREYKQGSGAALYRRSLYTFWKRTAPPPSMSTFDAPSRESFCLRRERSNTPLQALLLMNDVQHVEAARSLAQRLMSEGGITPEDRLAYAFRLVTARRPLESERTTLKQAFEKQLSRYAADPEAAKRLITYGETKPKPDFNSSELAAYTMVASVLLNMDETLAKN